MTMITFACRAIAQALEATSARSSDTDLLDSTPC
jgi:hypothetical protein